MRTYLPELSDYLNPEQGAAPAAQSKSALADLPSIITVEVVGYEMPASDDEQRKKKSR